MKCKNLREENISGFKGLVWKGIGKRSVKEVVSELVTENK